MVKYGAENKSRCCKSVFDKALKKPEPRLRRSQNVTKIKNFFELRLVDRIFTIFGEIFKI